MRSSCTSPRGPSTRRRPHPRCACWSAGPPGSAPTRLSLLAGAARGAAGRVGPRRRGARPPALPRRRGGARAQGGGPAADSRARGRARGTSRSTFPSAGAPARPAARAGRSAYELLQQRLFLAGARSAAAAARRGRRRPARGRGPAGRRAVGRAVVRAAPAGRRRPRGGRRRRRRVGGRPRAPLGGAGPRRRAPPWPARTRCWPPCPRRSRRICRSPRSCRACPRASAGADLAARRTLLDLVLAWPTAAMVPALLAITTAALGAGARAPRAHPALRPRARPGLARLEHVAAHAGIRAGEGPARRPRARRRRSSVCSSGSCRTVAAAAR